MGRGDGVGGVSGEGRGGVPGGRWRRVEYVFLFSGQVSKKGVTPASKSPS